MPGITALLYVGYRPMGYLKTNTQGVVTYDQVPEGFYGVYMVLPAEYAGWDEVAGLPRRDLVDGIHVMAGTDTTIRFEFLRRGTGTTVVQTVGEDNRPLPRRSVVLYHSVGYIAEARTDSTGRVTFSDVPTGIYGVSTPTLPPAGVPACDFVARVPLVMDGGHREEVRLVIPRCTGSSVPNP